MPRSIFYIPTSSNIPFVNAKEQLDDANIEDVANDGKFLKNVSGAVQWIALPIPDISTLTSAEDQFCIVYDHATTSFIMKDLRTVWTPLVDTQIKWWFDMGDASTMTFANPNSSLSQLRVAGGSSVYNSTSVFGGTTTPLILQPGINGTQALRFTNTMNHGIQLPIGSLNTADGSFMMCWVMKFTVYEFINVIGTVNAGSLRLFIIPTTSFGGAITLQFQGWDSGVDTNYTTNPTLFTENIYSMYFDQPNSKVRFYVNGTQWGSDITVTGYTDDATNAISIGSFSTSGDSFDGLFYQLAFSNNATVENRQRYEGYFAHKYNLLSLLPVDHPYKTAVPKY